MDIRYSAHPNDVKRYTTEELRREFLIENLYRPDEVTTVYSHVDRMVTLGCMPIRETVPIDKGIDVWAKAARWGVPEDLMGPAVFLASDASDFVNGHILYVDGGILAYIGKQP